MNTRHIKRARWHDYRSRSIYFITINKRGDAPRFGVVTGDCEAPPGHRDYPKVRYSDTGLAVKRMIYRLEQIIPSCRLLQYVIMPDHIHFLIFIQERTPLHLGNYISKFKNGLRQMIGFELFEPGFNDQIVGVKRDLRAIYNYIRENPYRLAMRRQKREWFLYNNRIRLNGKRYEAYGNLQILKNPFMEAIIIHRRDGEEKIMELRERWLRTAESGGAAVSAFISPREKEMRREIERVGGAVVLILEKPFYHERYKPAKHDFEQCAKGELVILAPAEEDWSGGEDKITRAACMKMNALAEYLEERGKMAPGKPGA